MEVKNHIQLRLFIKTMRQSHAKRALLFHLGVPHAIAPDPKLAQRASGDTGTREQGRERLRMNESVMHLLSLPTLVAILLLLIAGCSNYALFPTDAYRH